MGSNDTSAQQDLPPAHHKQASAASIALFAFVAIAVIAAAIYLFRTNIATGSWAQNYDPAGRWWISTIIAALPLIVLLGAMAIFRLKAHVAAVIGLVTALAVAIAIYHM